nr:hypothetical protein [Micromonospora sp. DSM 115978]
EAGRPGWRTVREFDTVWHCPAASLLDNNFDLAHIAYVHQATFGTPDSPRVVPGPVERTWYGLLSRGGTAVSARPGESVPTQRRVANEAWMPFSGVLRISYPDGLEHVIVKAIYPIDDRTCGLLQFCVRNDADTDRPPADIIDFDTRVAVEDRAVLERITRPYQLDLDANVHVATDRPSVALRRLWSE